MLIVVRMVNVKMNVRLLCVGQCQPWAQFLILGDVAIGSRTMPRITWLEQCWRRMVQDMLIRKCQASRIWKYNTRLRINNELRRQGQLTRSSSASELRMSLEDVEV